MEWYVPITIIPGIGLIIISTSNFLIALNNEISLLNNDKQRYVEIIDLKLQQLKKLSIAIVFQYLGILFFLFPGILMAVHKDIGKWPEHILILGVLAITISIFVLLVYSIKAVYIRQKHLKCTP